MLNISAKPKQVSTTARSRSRLSRQVGAVLFSAIACTAPSMSAAAEIVLKANSEDRAVQGTLIKFDGETYKMQTLLGVIWVDAKRFDCISDGCATSISEAQSAADIAGREKLGLDTNSN